MSWLDHQKLKIINKLKYDYVQLHNHILAMQTPLTNTERLENWIKLVLWLFLSLILIVLIHIEWTTLAGLYATTMMVIFWLKGWDTIARNLAQYLQRIQLGKSTVDPQLVNASRSYIAEQRLLTMLPIMADWQALTAEERNLTALRTLDSIYRVAVGIPPTTTNIVTSSPAAITDRLEMVITDTPETTAATSITKR